MARDQVRSYLVGGVNSPVRAFRAVGEEPLKVARAEGPFVYDEEGRRYLDFIGGWGALILGHAHPAVVEAVETAASRGICFGLSHPGEEELAARIAGAFPWVERVRLVNSGTEACMTAVRLARAATGRTLCVKFEGCYHGHADGFLVKMGSGGATLGLPSSQGVPSEIAGTTVVLPYNDEGMVRRLFAERGKEIAAVIMEPVAGNMGVVPPRPGFLETLREETRRWGALLIFDEVMTGFRVSRDGAAGRFGVRPDLLCLGKIIGGGLPVGAVAGPARVMDLLSPAGPVYQAGTFAGGPVVCAAGNATLRVCEQEDVWALLERLGNVLDRHLSSLEGVSYVRCGGMWSLFFLGGVAPRDFQEVRRQDGAAFARFHAALRSRGILAPPSAYEAWFLNAAMDEALLEEAARTIREAVEEARRG
ncbi:glutamate-1-semialdehyde 2,1-aminomutase [Spirochaeta thermophila]|uniref:Glutamate-1-semialdehyde 2,1-aminomutase n=1 Tax=Winmispira thermophila (strain ATCC 49972 / DSM 6192 / RI 19.B1) TaxID=665571 RepID=E0RN83_WINT6|nr:glutamate-1-semialdehyde 2,1-aminomutase [Spirochaeta thermophila]ADN02552.1 glutamate-1-semialdehyde 2,1-aminomutase [Spirochaeta thermophila DSM 6192]